MSETIKKRYEDSELVLRFFAYLNDYNSFVHSVEEFLESFVVKSEKNFDKKNFDNEFRTMLTFVEKHFPFGFTKTKNAKATPRVRFEAISVGVALALKIKPDLVPSSMIWLDSYEFRYHTTTHASNTPKKVIGRIEYVRDMLLMEDTNENNI